MAYRVSSGSFNDSPSAYNIITLGDLGVGKSSIIHAFINGSCSSDTPVGSSTIGSESKIVQQGSRLLQVEVWDTAAQERYDSITTQYYRHAHGCFICYDISSPESFRNVPNWLNSLQDKCIHADYDLLPPIILLGTKCDLRQDPLLKGTLIRYQDGENLLKQLEFQAYMEVSAHKNQNIEKAFNDMVKLVNVNRSRATSLRESSKFREESIRIGSQPSTSSPPKRSCCFFKPTD